MALKTIDWVVNTATTSGLTATTVATYTIPSGSSAYVEAIVVGRNTVNGDSCAIKLSATAKRVASTTIVGTVRIISALVADTPMAGVVVTIDALSPDVRVRATGVTSLTIEWQASMKIYIN